MNLLFIGDMYGPYFLGFYAIMGLLVYFLIIYLPTILDSEELSSKANLAPYDIAYIKGGVTEVLKLVTWSLVAQKKADLKVSKSKKSSKFSKRINCKSDGLHPLETEILGWIKTKDSKLKTFLFSKTIQKRAKELLQPLEDTLVDQGFIWSNKKKKDFKTYKIIGFLALLTLGIYKVYYALQTGHTNILFLIIEIFLFSSIILKIKFPNERKKAKSNFYELENKTNYYSDEFEEGYSESNLLLLSIVGFSVLEGSIYDDHYKHMNTFTVGNSINSGCSSCSSDSCSSSSCSSSSCSSSSCSSCGGCGGD